MSKYSVLIPLATIKSRVHTLALGTHQCTIYDNTKECHVDGMITRSMCMNEEVNCEDGSCIYIENRCDGKVNCFDLINELDLIGSPHTARKYFLRS